MLRTVFWILVFIYFPIDLIRAVWRNETTWDAGMLTGVLIIFSLMGIIRQIESYVDKRDATKPLGRL